MMTNSASLHAINADLHCHSTVSDGWLEPAAVVERAQRNGVELLALTDHDELGGLAEAAAAAARLGLRFVNGVEISASFAGQTIHIVGLGVDPDDAGLQAHLAGLRAGRDVRAQRMAASLAEAGIEGTLEGARSFARNPALLSRAHFARHLVAAGIMPDVRTVFDHYLVRGKPGFIEHHWASVAEVVSWIRAAGGIAVLAHPARYRLDDAARQVLLDTFIDAGGEAIEVVSGAHDEAEAAHYAEVARRRGLLASRASDFHGERESRVDLGGCPPLPADLTPVWSRLL